MSKQIKFGELPKGEYETLEDYASFDELGCSALVQCRCGRHIQIDEVNRFYRCECGLIYEARITVTRYELEAVA